MKKYDIIVDKRWLMLIYFLLVNLCFLISQSSKMSLIWIVNSIIWGIVFLLEFISIIKIWRKGRKEK